MRNRNYVNGIEGVSAGNTATVRLPIGRRYHALKLFLAATVSGSASVDPTAIISRVRVYVNSILMRDLTPAEIIKIAKFMGQTVSTTSGGLPIYFSEPKRASVIGEEALSWDLSDASIFSTFTVEVDFIAGITAPSLRVQMLYDFGRNVSDGKYFNTPIKQLGKGYNAASGAFDITTLDISKPINRIFLLPSTGNVTSVEVIRDGEKVLEGTKAENDDMLLDHGLDGTQFGYAIAFDADQQVSSPLLVGRELNVRPTFSAANQLRVIVENRANGFN